MIHTAAQPSHDWAAREPLTDFTVNANGTLVVLEAARCHAEKALIIFTSTNKVYGDTLTDADLSRLVARRRAQDSVAALLCVEVPDVRRFGRLHHIITVTVGSTARIWSAQ